MSNLTTTGVLGLFEKLITEHGSSVVQLKHLAFLKDQIASLEKHNEALKRAHADFVEERAKMNSELEQYRKPSDCIPWQGVLIQRLPEGGYSDSPICSVCKVVLSVHVGLHVYYCSHKCGFVSNVKSYEYKAHIDRLTKQENEEV